MRIIALDVGKKRIGVAIANSDIKIARPYDIVLVEGKEFAQICEIILEEKISRIVVGKPRSNEGNETEQTKYVYRFVRRLQRFCIQQGYNFPEVVYQDESLTSVEAKKRIGEIPYIKRSGKIDMEAATIILQDYLESTDFKKETNAR